MKLNLHHYYVYILEKILYDIQLIIHGRTYGHLEFY